MKMWEMIPHHKPHLTLKYPCYLEVYLILPQEQEIIIIILDLDPIYPPEQLLNLC